MSRVSPFMSPARAEALLADVIYERVVECIDLTRLAEIEQELAELHAEQPPSDRGISEAWARGMIDAALARLPADPRRYLLFGECGLCAAEAAAHAPRD
jgi:hypothetical protein